VLPRLDRQSGQGLVEYGLVLVMVTLVILFMVVMMGPTVAGMFSGITGSI